MKKWLASATIAVMLVSITACGGTSSSAGSGSSGNAPSASKSTSQSSAASTGSNSSATDASGKYNPPITLHTVRATDTSIKFKDGESWTNNAWYNSYVKDLGIKLKYDWIVDSQQYDSKMNVTITSGQLPDFFQVNATQLKQLEEAGKIEDLTPYYNKYASDLVKKSLAKGPEAMKASSYKGKMMAIPPAEDPIGGLDMVWIRNDWLKKLNLNPPKTMADVMNIAKAFTNQDPNGDGKKDTYGLALYKDLWGGGAFDIEGFMNGLNAYPDIWIKDKSGNLVYGSIQPEVKDALAKLQDMYKQGEIDPEFGSKDIGKESDLTTAGKIGMEFGQQWNSIYPLQTSFDKDKADWTAYPIPGGGPQANLSFNNFVVVRKGAPHPEAVIKMLNLGYDHLFGPNADSAKYHDANGVEFFKYNALFNMGTSPLDNVDHYLKVSKAIASKDPSSLNSEEKGYYDKITQFLSTDKGPGWGYEKIFDANGSQAVLNEYKTGKLPYMKDQFYGAPTPTMVSKKASLDKMEIETFTQIILGAPLSKFDEFVANWKKLGGDQITKEVNDWYKANQ